MKRSELEHLIRVAGSIADDTEIIIIGSQSILGQFPNAPATLLVSADADLYPRNRPELAELIDGSIGEGSLFHEQYGYYVQGVSEHTATLPREWRQRLVKLVNANTCGVVGLCLDANDLAVSKYIAGRQKDLEFTRELAAHAMTSADILLARIEETEVPEEHRILVRARIRRDFASAKSRT
jgi:hypothetical protein